jgi:hypothetical protein
MISNPKQLVIALATAALFVVSPAVVKAQDVQPLECQAEFQTAGPILRTGSGHPNRDLKGHESGGLKSREGGGLKAREGGG